MSDKLRVLAICQEDPEFILGGMGVHVRELYRAMAKQDDVEIDLLSGCRGEESEEFFGYMKHPGDKLVCYKPNGPSMATMFLDDIQMGRTLTRLLAQGKRWDVVHVHEWNSVQIGRTARDALKVPMVGTMHLCLTALTLMDECPTDKIDGPPPEETIYMMQQEAHLIVDTDRLILCSDAYRRMAHDLFLTDRPIDVIYNGIRLDEWSRDQGNANRARAAHNLPPRPVALFVGRIADMKGIRPLLDAIEAKDTGYCYVLAGEINADTPEQRDAWDVTVKMKALEKKHPQRIRWVGFRCGQELKDLYTCADVALMPSVHEPFGIVALEHMAMGTPLISTEVDGLREIVVGNGGDEYAFIIRPNCADDIVAAVEYCKDDMVRAELTSLGLKRARDFDWDEVAAQTVSVYDEVTGRMPCPSS